MDELLCKFTRCMGEPFPAPLPGVNDLPACQQEDKVLDITFRGPSAGNEEAFYRVFSPLIEVSIPTAFGRFPGTTNVRDFQVINGLFDAPARLATNEETTGSGEMAVYFANYAAEAYPAVFASQRVGEALQQALPVMFNNRPFLIVINRMDDQDFDLGTVLRDFDEVMEVDLVLPNAGQEARFDSLRKEFISRARNIPGTRVHTFSPIALPPGIPPQWPSEGPDAMTNLEADKLEMVITVYRWLHHIGSILNYSLLFLQKRTSTSGCNPGRNLPRRLCGRILLHLLLPRLLSPGKQPEGPGITFLLPGCAPVEYLNRILWTFSHLFLQKEEI